MHDTSASDPVGCCHRCVWAAGHPAFENIQWKTYLVFGVFNVAMFVHVFFAFVETRGKTLEEVEEIFDSGLHAWQTRKLTGGKTHVDELAAAVERGEKILDGDQSPSEHEDVKSPGSEKDSNIIQTHVA